MLQEWVADPSCAYSRFRESHKRKESRYVEATFELVSVPELNMRYQTDIYPARAAHVKKLVAGAVGKPTWHPQYPKDPEWKQYRILQQTIDGNRNESAKSTELLCETQLDGSAAAEFTVAAVSRMRGELPPAHVPAAAETEGAPRAGKAKKTVAPKTEQQLAAANRKQKLTGGQAKVHKTITTITKF
eukprot:14066290-Heterocapsa_arctica.AAC.1